MMGGKILGYFLISAGILILLSSAVSVYLVFTKQAKPVQLFDFPAISLDPNQFIPTFPQTLENQTLPKNNQKKAELIPASVINDSSNLLAHLLLMGFIASIGYKLASLGTMLVRPIVVKLKATSEELKNNLS